MFKNRIGKNYFATASALESEYWRSPAETAHLHPHHRRYQAQAWLCRVILPAAGSGIAVCVAVAVVAVVALRCLS